MVRPFSIKICGVSHRTDAELAAQWGATAIGLNFYPRSLRYIDPVKARLLSESLQQLAPHVKRVGVFVNETPDRLRELQADVGLDFLQLHGDEKPEICGEIDPARVIRAIRLAPQGVPSALAEIQNWSEQGVKHFLFDKHASAAYGGTGESLDWHLIPELRRLSGLGPESTWILAGGLNSDNVAEAVAVARPDAVDVASGIEGLPGKKDPGLLRSFLDAALAALSGEPRDPKRKPDEE